MKPILLLITAAMWLIAGTSFGASRESAAPAPQNADSRPSAGTAEEKPSSASEETPQAPLPLTDQEQEFLQTAARAESGDAMSMLRMGNFYEQGIVAPRHYRKAREWYEKAADAGLAEGYYNAGVCYEIGLGTADDMQKAVVNFQQAASRGLPQALYKMAILYRTGNGIPQDDAKAVEYLTLAADAGNAFAAIDLGAIYTHGSLNRKQNLPLALNLFLRAAEQGYPEAMKNIAVLYKNGFKDKPDPVNAFKWYSISRQSGYSSGDLAGVMDVLRAVMTPDQVLEAETAAAQWLAASRKAPAGGSPLRP
ncbi:MAG: SEL1-like repeat protein [Desulfovibrio sp.]|jgi:TPR repeat protein|nr:SEL1-like repeat protein [Desulfovibrio sp.]